MKKVVVFFVLMLAAGFVTATDYYIDYENGDDSLDGLSTSTAWKHAPGDDNALGNAASVNPSSTINFKGGVEYKGTIDIFQDNLKYIGDSWPGLEGVKAIIDGSEDLTGWTKCGSQSECGENPNWNNIYYVNSPSEATTYMTDWVPSLIEGNSLSWNAQSPNPVDPFFMDEEEGFRVLSASGEMSTTHIRDPDFFNQEDSDYWSNSFVLVWRNFNVVEFKKINSFDPATDTITFDELGLEPYDDPDMKRYSVVNHISIIDKPGEYYYDFDENKIYYWSFSSGEPQASVSVRREGIDINDHNDITIEGFLIKGLGSFRNLLGDAILNSKYDGASNLVVRNNEITLNRLMGSKHGGIEPTGMSNVLIENNYIHDNQKATGMQIRGANNVTIRQNVIDKVGSVGLWIMGSSNVDMINNTIGNIYGSHTDAMAVYQGSSDVLVLGNYIYNAAIGSSNEASNNVAYINNIIDLGGEDHNGLVLWSGGQTGYFYLFNNIIIGSNKVALSFGEDQTDDLDSVVVKNNIIDGWTNNSVVESMFDADHNIYTLLAWNQKERYGWYSDEGDVVELDKNNVFVDYEGYDYDLRGLAVGAGTDLSSYYNDLGVLVPESWDIGASGLSEFSVPERNDSIVPVNNVTEPVNNSSDNDNETGDGDNGNDDNNSGDGDSTDEGDDLNDNTGDGDEVVINDTVAANNDTNDNEVAEEESSYLIWIILGVVIVVLIVLSLVIGFSRSRESI